MTREIKAYLSHRRDNGKLSEFARFLLENAPPDIDLKVDCRDAELSRPIDQFIGELKTASGVIFLLNDRFFRSPWCMGELHTFIDKRAASLHGFFIACDGWMAGQDARAFFAEQERELIAFWEGVANDGATDEIRCEALRFVEALPEILEILKRLNIPTEEIIREGKGDAVWKRLREQRARYVPDFTPRCGESLSHECRRRLVHLLDRTPVYRRELAIDCGLGAETATPEVVEKLWDKTTGMAEQLSALHRAANEAIKATQGEGKEDLKRYILEFLGVSLLGMLDREQHEHAVNPRYGLFDSEFLVLNEKSPEVAEICFASLQKQVKTMLAFDSDQRRLGVSKYRYFDEDRKEPGPKFSVDSPLDAQLRLVWNHTFPSRMKESGEYLQDDDFRRLDKELRRRFERGNACYFLVADSDTEHALMQEGVAGALKYRLPFLFVFRTGVDNAPRLLLGDFEESDIEDELASFAQLF